MDIMQGIAIVSGLTGLFVAGATCAFQVIIKFNDLKHQEASLVRIESKLTIMDSKLDKNAERLSKVEGKCAANHG